jgi:RND family efflux transporter MFP subunit
MEPAPKFDQPVRLQSHSGRKQLIHWLVIAAVALAAATAAYLYFTKQTPVTATRPIRGPAAELVYATGYVEPERPVEISSRITAPILNVLVEEGDRVSRGQRVAILDSADARANIAQLRAQRVNADADEARAMALFRQGWSTRAARDKAVATADAARAGEASARARLEQYTIRSPLSGVMLRREVEAGDLAVPGKALFQVGDPASLRVTAIVDERDIPMVRKGAEALMSTDAYPGRVIRGRVYEITPGGDPAQRAFRVRIRPDSVGDLPIGLTLEVNLLISEKQSALLVPASAVKNGVVWTVAGERARPVSVRIGIRGADRTEVTSGLAADACIITDPGAGMKTGQRVKATGC